MQDNAPIMQLLDSIFRVQDGDLMILCSFSREVTGARDLRVWDVAAKIYPDE